MYLHYLETFNIYDIDDFIGIFGNSVSKFSATIRLLIDIGSRCVWATGKGFSVHVLHYIRDKHSLLLYVIQKIGLGILFEIGLPGWPRGQVTHNLRSRPAVLYDEIRIPKSMEMRNPSSSISVFYVFQQRMNSLSFYGFYLLL